MIHDHLKDAHRYMIKEALVGMLGRVAKTIARNPIRSGVMGLTAVDAANQTTHLHDVATGGHNLAAGAAKVNM